MDISVASAGEPSDRAAPPAEGAAEEPVRAQPRYPRGGNNLPTGPIRRRFPLSQMGRRRRRCPARRLARLLADQQPRPQGRAYTRQPAPARRHATRREQPRRHRRARRRPRAGLGQDPEGTYGDILLPPTPAGQRWHREFPQVRPRLHLRVRAGKHPDQLRRPTVRPSAPPNNIRGALAIELP